LQPTNNEEEPNTRQKKGKKKESVLSDMSFIESKNKKLKLEIDALEMKTERQEERDALELDLLRSKIAFFETLTCVIKKKNSFAFLESLYEEIED